MRTAYALGGLPGSGKSEAADIGSTLTGGDVLHAGDMIREMMRKSGITDPTSHELAEFAAEQRREHGGGFFGEKTVSLLLADQLEVGYPLFIDSVRHVRGLREFREYFDQTYFLWVEAPFAVRLERLQNRGRDDEDGFDEGDLLVRDRTELEELGQHTLLDEARIDYTIRNTGTQEELKNKLDDILM